MPSAPISLSPESFRIPSAALQAWWSQARVTVRKRQTDFERDRAVGRRKRRWRKVRCHSNIPSVRGGSLSTDRHSCCPSPEPCFQLLCAWSQSAHQRPAESSQSQSTAAAHPQQQNKACTAVTARMLQLQPIVQGTHSPAERSKTSLHLHLHPGKIAGPAAPLCIPAALCGRGLGLSTGLTDCCLQPRFLYHNSSCN